MKFSLWPSPQQPFAGIVEAARFADEHGFFGVWFADHFMPHPPLGDETGPQHECWSVLAALGALTTRVRLGSLVCGNTYRHPAVLLKQAVTADHASGGRVVLGIGAGWQENEHLAYGIPYHDVPERLARLDEACRLIRALLGVDEGGRAAYTGERYSLTDAPLSPRPTGPFPLLVGGGGERVTMRIAAEHADEWNVWGDPETMRHKGDVLARHCEALGRDPGSIRRSANALLFLSDDPAFVARIRDQDLGLPVIAGSAAEVIELAGAYVDAGVDELIIPDWNLGAGEKRLDRLRRFHAEVAAAFS